MPKTDDLRRKAALYRRLAAVKTSGGHLADRVLVAQAERLECEAATLEQGNVAALKTDLDPLSKD